MGIITSYITYRGRAKTRHGVHPPFIYQFIDEVLYAKDALRSDEIEALRRSAEANHAKLTLVDYGAGTRIADKSAPTIARIAKRSSSPIVLSALLQRIIDFYEYQHVLEFGTNLGFNTAYLAAAKAKPKVISMEGDSSLMAIAHEHLNSLGLNADLRLGQFDDVMHSAFADANPLDMVYIDGNHQYEPTLRYARKAVKHLQSSGLLVVGDIHWSTGMEAAWAEIKKLSEVRTTIDLFHAGLAWINPELTPEHFTIKFP